MNNLTDDKRMLVYGPKSPHTDIFCFSTTRYGGCSKGNYASFNCNHYCGDAPDKVERNRELLCSLLPVRMIELCPKAADILYSLLCTLPMLLFWGGVL